LIAGVFIELPFSAHSNLFTYIVQMESLSKAFEKKEKINILSNPHGSDKNPLTFNSKK